MVFTVGALAFSGPAQGHCPLKYSDVDGGKRFTEVDFGVAGTRNTQGEFESYVVSPVIEARRCVGPVVAKLAVAGDWILTNSSSSTTGRIAPGLQYWFDDSFWVGSQVFLGYEDINLPVRTPPARVPQSPNGVPFDPGGQPVVSSGGSVATFVEDQRFTSQYEAGFGGSFYKRKNAGQKNLLDRSFLRFHFFGSYVNKRAPDSSISAIAFDEQFWLARGGVAVGKEFGGNSSAFSHIIEARADYLQFVTEPLFLNGVSSFELRWTPRVVDARGSDRGPKNLFSLGLVYRNGNNGFQGVAVSISKSIKF